MKILQILSLLLVALVSLTSAQCRGGAPRPSCDGGVNVGHRRGRGCIPSGIWAYDPRTRQCRRIAYLGCGGNQNRWCSQSICNRRCVR
ncbi:major allergen Ani s 1-like [Cochliomyia hominivorax]